MAAALGRLFEELPFEQRMAQLSLHEPPPVFAGVLYEEAERFRYLPGVDPDHYERSLPFFRQAVAAVRAKPGDAIRAMAEKIVALLRSEGIDRRRLSQLKPYLEQFVLDVQAGRIELQPRGYGDAGTSRPARGAPLAEGDEIARIAALFGGLGVPRAARRPLDVHEALGRGLPGAALTKLVENVPMLHDETVLEPALGVSLRTLQRYKAESGKYLSPEQSGRVWKFAEVLARATNVLGSQDEAERWLDAPAMALEQRRPVELLASPAGIRLVEDLLGRLEYGVYT